MINTDAKVEIIAPKVFIWKPLTRIRVTTVKRIISHIHTGKLTESSVIKFIQYIKEQILIITEIIVKNPKRPEVKISKSITIPISKNRNESRFWEIFVAVKLSLLFFIEANNLSPLLYFTEVISDSEYELSNETVWPLYLPLKFLP